MMRHLDAACFRLCIAGAGPLAAQLQKNCEEQGLRHIYFLGHIASREDLADIYANADAFVHPNPHEPFGIAPLEAMSSGLPVIAPHTGGVTSYANSSNAWLVSPEPSAFAEAARSIRSDRALCYSKVTSARLTAARFRWDVVTAQFFDLCADLIAITRNSRSAPQIAPRVWSTPGGWLGRETG